MKKEMLVRIWHRGLAMALAAVLAGALSLPSFLGLRSLAVSLSVAMPAFVGLWSDEADARRSGGGGSGGYSRPGAGVSRTPSFSNNKGSSGGYFRSSPTPSIPSRTPSLSPSDRDASRAASRQGLRDFQARQAPPRTETPSSGFRVPRQAPTVQSYIPPAYAGPSRFGMWDAAMFFLLLNSLSNPSHAAFFHHHAEDPNYLAWRSEANKLAATDPELKAKLEEVDRTVAAQASKPREAGYLPPDLAKQEPENEGSSWGTILVILLVGGAAYWFFVRRKPKAISTEAEMGSTPFELGKSILHGKIAGSPAYRPGYLHLGMGVKLDPSPFILLGPTSQVPRPTHNGDRATVTALSRLVTPGETPEAARHAWLYLSETSFVEVALAVDGQPEGARYFAKIDEVYPADSEEWNFWLAQEDGMIGWPEFQTKDGHVYARHWLPGDRWVPPRRLLETRERADGVTERTISMMLYARGTGQQSPAPDTEYLLIFAAETPNESWVELHLGIDLPLSSLGLS